VVDRSLYNANRDLMIRGSQIAL